jgi:hypothetical protein
MKQPRSIQVAGVEFKHTGDGVYVPADEAQTPRWMWALRLLYFEYNRSWRIYGHDVSGMPMLRGTGRTPMEALKDALGPLSRECAEKQLELDFLKGLLHAASAATRNHG